MMHHPRRGADLPHVLVVEIIGDGTDEFPYEQDFTIEHPESCTTIQMPAEDGVFQGSGALPPIEYDCPTGRNQRWSGFDDFPPLHDLPAGRYHFYLWWSGPDIFGEYDGGYEWLTGEDMPAVRTDVELWTDGLTGEHVRIHEMNADCQELGCCLHNPSDHHMREWPLHWRGDRGIMERICPHGVGHPDPDASAYRRRIGTFRESDDVHGCCGCCTPSTSVASV